MCVRERQTVCLCKCKGESVCERVCLYVRETDCKKCAILQSLNFDKNVKQEIEKKINSNFWLIFFSGKKLFVNVHPKNTIPLRGFIFIN